MKRIVVPTDFSNLSRSAALYAIDLAAKTGARVMLVSVIEIERAATQLMNWRKLQDQMDNDAAQSSARFMKEIHNYTGGVSVSYTTLRGPSIEGQVLEFARSNKADLIVTGTKGASGLKAVVLGSNTAALINKSTIPVIAVPGDLKFNGFDRIVLASDMNDLDKEVKAVAKFAKVFDAQIDILHVSGTEAKRQHSELEAILRRMTGHKKITLFVVTNEDVTAALNTYVKEHDTDLLVMFTHELGLFEKLFGRGHTRSMSFQTQIPLMAMKKAK